MEVSDGTEGLPDVSRHTDAEELEWERGGLEVSGEIRVGGELGWGRRGGEGEKERG